MPKTTKVPSGSTVRHAAQALRQEVLSRTDGEFLGSESELVARLKVSRPTFRQSAKLLEQEQLLLIKRGVGGGFFARRPTVRGVTHVASVYLLARKATMADAIRAGRPLFSDTARLAAARSDRLNNSRIKDFLRGQEEASAMQFEFHSFLKFEREFLYLFASLSGNPVLELYTEVLVEFAGSYVGASVYYKHPERVAKYVPARNDLLKSVLSGDQQIAQLMSLRRSDMIIGWIDEDLVGASAAPRVARKRPTETIHKLIGLARDPVTMAAEDYIGGSPLPD